MTPEEVSAVEGLVNGWVADAAPTTTAVMGLKEARAAGATAMFGEKYDDVVRVVEVPGVSMELCGGETGGGVYGSGGLVYDNAASCSAAVQGLFVMCQGYYSGTRQLA
jgi:hypothetical protein